jgi:hypothetical protein
MMELMQTLHGGVRYLHIALGFLGLAAFWFPIFARKGGPLHVTAGRVFVWCAYAVTVSAVVSCLYYIAEFAARGVSPADDPNFGFLVFLAYLALVTFAGVRHGVVVARAKKHREAAGTAFHRALAWASIFSSVVVVVFAVVFWGPVAPVLLALSPIGIVSGRGMLRYVSARPMIARAWFYEHMGAMIGSGIAFHTAFAVFGSRNLFDVHLVGFWGVLPWILPTAIGIPASLVWDRHYRSKFRDPRDSLLPVEAERA